MKIGMKADGAKYRNCHTKRKCFSFFFIFFSGGGVRWVIFVSEEIVLYVCQKWVQNEQFPYKTL